MPGIPDWTEVHPLVIIFFGSLLAFGLIWMLKEWLIDSQVKGLLRMNDHLDPEGHWIEDKK